MAIISPIPKMYGHQIAGEEPRPKGVLYDYVWAGNGLFIRAERESLKVCFPVKEFEVACVPEISPSFEMAYERVPLELTKSMLVIAEYWAVAKLESLFHFVADSEGLWELHNPEQERKGGSCRPLDDGPDSTYQHALIEAHSHHRMRAYFSGMDDSDETGFRIYAVLGEVLTEPKIRVRVGVYGHFWEIPAEWVFELPKGLIDVNGRD